MSGERDTLLGARHTTADGFEYEAEPDSGVYLATGESWEGVRVKYRRIGVRRWTRFIIVHPADKYEVYCCIVEHSAKFAA